MAQNTTTKRTSGIVEHQTLSEQQQKGSSSKKNVVQRASDRRGLDVGSTKNLREAAQSSEAVQTQLAQDESTSVTAAHKQVQRVTGGGTETASADDIGMHVTFKVRMAKGFGAPVP